MFRFIIHYGLHFIAPVLIAHFLFRKDFIKVSLILLLGIVIDVDHLWASPVFDPDRCSIGFHFFHSYIAIALYLLLLFLKRTRIFGIALLLHILADIADCLLMS
ncbi:DUF6122 family protein [Galbibacter pacificus]|uniref:DUF6122 family protein n=1 Tax=Galbibacter pacificus TaxID=2996052 RepID=A0ABT6FNI9_9FLAO|nr:DUF6122 family protein [Galbibacter pacificus]MDG3581350.1 DUF6122 family protein [Galbibacter pacificus]MDG3584828.1 DUF6122 family protein [Galbibacter pacificus]